MYLICVQSQSDDTGVGLYMSKMIIEDSMSGELVLDNYQNGVLARLILKSEEMVET